MADICSIFKLPKYQRIKECVSTSNQSKLATLSGYYMDSIERLPNKDELSFVDSSKILESNLQLDKDNCTTMESIFDYTGTNTLEDATIKLNSDIHEDLNISLMKYGDSVKVYYKRRPHKINGLSTNSEVINNLSTEHKKTLFQNMLFELSNQFGIKFNYITNQELNSQDWLDLIGDAKLTNAFVFQGDIYINTDNATIDAPLHELTHILLGNIRYINPNLYTELLSQVEQLPNIQTLFPQYLNRTHTDILEEILVTEFSKYISNKPSLFDSMSEKYKYNVQYYMFRCLDTMIEGNYSASSLSTQKIGSESLNSLLSKLESVNTTNIRSGKGDTSYIHRIVNNQKSKLLKSKDLIEEC